MLRGGAERQVDMRRSLTLLATVMVLIGLIAAPAAADPPTEAPFLAEFTDVDPCTGLEMDITVMGTFFDHIGHNNNFVGRIGERTGFTSSGYVLVGGHDNFRANKNGVSGTFKDVWRNPDNGDKIQATGRFLEVKGDVVIDRFDLRCVGGPTILPS
jgi:hypothetical protein